VWWGRPLTGRAGTRLDRMLGQTSTGDNTLLGAIHSDAKSLCDISNVYVSDESKLTHPSSYSCSILTRDPAFSSSSSPMEGLKSSVTRWTLLGPEGGPLGGPLGRPPAIAPTGGGGPVGAGPGDAGMLSVPAGIAGAPSKVALALAVGGRSWFDWVDVMAATDAAAARAATGAAGNLARSALGAEECAGELLRGESGMDDWLESRAALFPKGFCWDRGVAAREAESSLKGSADALEAPRRSQALVGDFSSVDEASFFV
jgi:hypothetical protein